jgi:hypothetical protein
MAYTTPSVTPVPGAPCSYSLTGVAGTMDANIAPSADGTQITVQLFLHDVASAVITCGPATSPLGSPLVGTINFQTANPSFTVPSGTPSDTPLSWNLATPFPSNGQLDIHVEPLTS